MNAAGIVGRLRELRSEEERRGRAAAEPELARFLAALPADPDLMLVAAQQLCLQHRFDVCVDLAERALEAAAPTPQRRFTLAEIYYLARRPADAAAQFRALLQQHAGNAQLLTRLGVALVALGDTDGARDALDQAIAADPRAADAMHERVLLERMRADAPVVAKLEALAREVLPAEKAVRAHYALGKAWDDLGEHNRAFAAYAAGAAAFRAMAPFNDASVLPTHAAAERIRVGETAATGGFIFVVGMPRSGTTLTEQILLGDPRVTSVDETTAFADSVRPWLADMDVAAMGENYRLRLRDYGAQDAAIVLDKTPTNYLWAPLARAALGAHVVHCRRDVLDTCWSLYTTWFGMGTAWSYDFAEIARAYARYWRLMQRWRDEIPLIEIEYEALVRDPEPQAKALFAACGLDWRADALAFAERPRTVMTPSMAQVRKPVSAGSVRRLAPYLPMLAPLIAALRDEGVPVEGV